MLQPTKRQKALVSISDVTVLINVTNYSAQFPLTGTLTFSHLYPPSPSFKNGKKAATTNRHHSYPVPDCCHVANPHPQAADFVKNIHQGSYPAIDSAPKNVISCKGVPPLLLSGPTAAPLSSDLPRSARSHNLTCDRDGFCLRYLQD